MIGEKMTVYWRQLKTCEGVTAITDLRPIVQAFNRTVGIWGLIRRDGKELPLSVSVVVGAVPVDGKADMQLLGYSPVRSGNQTHCIPTAVISQSSSLLLKEMIGLITHLDDMGRNLWKPHNKQLCPKYLSSGSLFYIKQQYFVKLTFDTRLLQD
jgi:hypothetical protein